ncbi:nuclear transport factor 2 family protein [Nocardioides sp. zg-536]|uniref:Nuclear transport factor 2 family protein n=1 Tax=Nocardioides faecalis TaxID=2803858 RepID=A0A938Y500_9ACTN|nr:nuclear transport factor 2 family protein [Nocardioides faecalis]MBM9460128.1 nuclear transport factor 2 family protein [Nocardioides faecalis]MBS4754227.1 nuclear transport factor 2 family protein [Nocardioides faecalis]QVI60077.1 nuclear transport factor 2 family protein [Nocardioides faecalis]
MTIEERLQRLEDVVAITQLVASYGPLVDAGEAERVAELWTEDGIYDVDEYYMGSRAEVDAMVRSDAHQGLIGQGCSHFLGPAHVTVDGDRAVAVCESVLLVRHGDRVFPARIGANHFELARTTTGWQTTRRTTRGLDGGTDARDLLSRTGRI